MNDLAGVDDPTTRRTALTEKLDFAQSALAQASAFAKQRQRSAVLDIARRLMRDDEGVLEVYKRIESLEVAGIFDGTDWAEPDILQATVAGRTLKLSDTPTAMVEALNHLRMLAVANRDYFHSRIASEHAQNFLAQVVGLNLDLVFGTADEASRSRGGGMDGVCRTLYAHIVQKIGHDQILDHLITEIWRLLAQRPIVVDDIKAMIAQISVWLIDTKTENAGGGWGADRLISAVFGPTAACREDPGLGVFEARLREMDRAGLEREAISFARSMHDTGLVSAYHAHFLQFVNSEKSDLIPTALGLSTTGTDTFKCYSELVHALIDAAVRPETAQAVYGLSLMLERGILFMPPVAPALWRQLGLTVAPGPRQTIATVFGVTQPAEVFLTAGVLTVMGLPFGVGQGNNPTCQAARAISMWSYSDPDYLLQVITWASRDDEVVITFEGEPVTSKLDGTVAAMPPLDVDSVSTVVVPHLDRIYAEMGRRCADRGDDLHRWVNREMHGWWVGRGSAIAVDVATGKLRDYEDFVRRFYAAYHPAYNGNQPVVHPQPAGIAVTDSAARYVGWHAISICRVGLDQRGEVRVYFYNPNNDSGQDWGNGVVVATDGNGERYGESSLPVAAFTSRLYLFHFDPLEQGTPDAVPAEEIAEITALARESWAKDR